jgi:hypothetical protein
MYRVISDTEYDKLWDKLKNSRRTTTDDYPSYHMKGMACLPHSGPGTPFKDEYDRLMHKANHPDKPPCLAQWTQEGLEYIYPEKFRSYLENNGLIEKENKNE